MAEYEASNSTPDHQYKERSENEYGAQVLKHEDAPQPGHPSTKIEANDELGPDKLPAFGRGRKLPDGKGGYLK